MKENKKLSEEESINSEKKQRNNLNIILIILIFINIFIAIFFCFYYIKPQREFIKINTQDCIKKAMDPINKEVNKTEKSIYYSDEWFVNPLEKQEYNLNKCLDAYNTILFSKPEKDLILLNTILLIEDQKNKIEDYKKVYHELKEKNQKYQEKLNKCKQLDIEYEAYEKCLNNKVNILYGNNNCVLPDDYWIRSSECILLDVINLDSNNTGVNYTEYVY